MDRRMDGCQVEKAEMEVEILNHELEVGAWLMWIVLIIGTICKNIKCCLIFVGNEKHLIE